MKCIYLLYTVLLWIGSVEGVYNFTFAMAQQCKEHVCHNGYKYETFYNIRSDVRKVSDSVLELHLAILAGSNGHILLSTLPYPDANDPVYEIVVGGGGNKFTELRRNLRRNAKQSKKTPNVLSAVEFRSFYIKITIDGEVEFGQEGDPLPLLTYTDVNPLTINYFSFASWTGVPAKFLYDCPAPGSERSSATPDSQQVAQNLSNSEQLKRTLLLDRQPSFPPGPNVTVKIGVKITSVSYSPMETKLSTGIAVVTTWIDNTLAWDPDKFNGTTQLKFWPGQIWRPRLYVYNADSIGLLESKNPGLITVAYNGEATFHFKTKTTTFCFDPDESTKSWPHDQYNCVIIIEAWEAHEKLIFSSMLPNDTRMKIFSGIDEVAENEWAIIARKAIIEGMLWNQLYEIESNETHQSDRLIINFELQRIAIAHSIVFYTPLLVLVTIILLSFWSEPLQMSRVWFYAGTSVIISLGLCYIDFLVPFHTVPSILILYSTVLMGVSVALVINVILMTSTAERVCKSVLIQNLLVQKWFRMLFCLPPMKAHSIYESINEGFVNQEEDEGFAASSRNGNVEEMESENSTYGEKIELAEAIDKFLFSIYLIVFAVMLALHY